MAINYELLNKGGISLGTNFELLSEKPLDSRLVVPSLTGLQNYIDNAAAYEGMIAYVSSEKKHYEVKVIDGVLSYRPFGLTNDELNDLIVNATTAAMEFKGATATLPENPAKGDMYKVAGENINIKIDDVDAKLGDSIVYDGTKWFLIPSGDDIEDTWRPVDGVNNDATLKFVDGDKTVAAVAADGTIKYNHATVEAPKLLAENEQTRTYITAVETDGYGHITGYKTATENVVDTNTEYTFESQVESSSVYFNVTADTENAAEQTIYVDAYSKNEADGKFVAKEGHIAYTQDEKDKLAGLSNYDDEEVRGLIGDNAQAIENLEDYVGTIPTDEKYADITNVISYVNKKAEETLAAAQGGSSETAASVKQQLDNYKSENDTRVKDAEDAIDAIEADYLKGADKTELSGAIATEKSRAEGIEAGLRTDVDAIKADYLKAADIANFETKENVKKVSDDLAAETKARTEADSAFETRIAALEGNFGDGEGTVEAQIAAAVKVEEDARKLAVQGVQSAVDGVAGRMTTAEGKISALETASATHATKDELNAVDAKFADYNTIVAQKAIDDAQDARIKAIEDDYLVEADIANFETKENVKKVADDLAAYVESNNAAVADRYTKEEADGKFALIADAYNDEEVRGLIAGNTTAIETEKSRAEGVEEGLAARIKAVEDDYLVEADKTELSGLISAEEARAKGVEESLQTQINTIMHNPDAEGAINSINEFTDYVKTHGTIADGMRTDINKNKEDIADLAEALTEHEKLSAETYETKTDAAAKLTAAKGYTDTEVAKDRERLTALESVKDAYKTADATLKSELQKEIDDDVKVVSDALASAQTELSEAIEAAKTDAANKDAAVLATAQEGIADVQGALDAYKTSNNAAVALKANAADVYTKAEVEALLTWGSF